MQARIIVTDPPTPTRFFELCLHHNNFPEWEWMIAPSPLPESNSEQILSLAGPVTDWSSAPESLRNLGPGWTTLNTNDREWVRKELLAPLIAHLKAHLARVRDFATLCGSPAELYPAMNSMLEQAERDYLFTARTPFTLTGRWRREHMNDSHPEQDTPLAHDAGILQIFTPDGTSLLMQCPIERWRDGLYWISNLEEDFFGAFVPGLMVAYLDCLPAGFLSQDNEDSLAPPPESLHPDLQAWMIATILWPDEIHPDPEHILDNLRERAEELSPTAIGRAGQQYSKHLAIARVIENRSVEEILDEFTTFDE